MVVYIYALRHPVTKQVSYVGKSTAPRIRLTGHLSAPTTGEMAEWFRQLRKASLLPELFVVEVCCQDTWPAAEKRWIEFYHRCGHPVLNVVHKPIVRGQAQSAEVTEESELLMGSEAAELLGVSDARIRQLCLEGAFVGAMKRGNWWFIPRASVEAFQSDPSIRRRKSKRIDTDGFLRPAFTSP